MTIISLFGSWSISVSWLSWAQQSISTRFSWSVSYHICNCCDNLNKFGKEYLNSLKYEFCTFFSRLNFENVDILHAFLELTVTKLSSLKTVRFLAHPVLPSLSFKYAKRLSPLKCAYFDRLQAAVILIKGLLSKYAKLIILKNLALNTRTRGPDLP